MVPSPSLLLRMDASCFSAAYFFFFIPTKRRDRRVPSPWPWPLCRVPLAALWWRRGQRGCQHRSRNGMFMEAVAGQQEGGKFQILDDKLLKTEGGFLSGHFPHL